MITSHTKSSLEIRDTKDAGILEEYCIQGRKIGNGRRRGEISSLMMGQVHVDR